VHFRIQESYFPWVKTAERQETFYPNLIPSHCLDVISCLIFVLLFLNFLLLVPSLYISRNSAIFSPGFYFSPDRIVSATSTALDVSTDYLFLCILLAYLSTLLGRKHCTSVPLKILPILNLY
jgi:hypothetical protein